MNRPIVGGLFVCLSLFGGCAPRVTPPPAPPHPVAVAVADNGRHTSLILPAEKGGLLEFAWGDYAWFAANHNSSGDGFAALFWSGGSTLGMRRFPGAAIEQDLIALGGAKRVLRFDAEAGDVARLRDKLAAAFLKRSESGETYNDASKMFFVRDPEHYCFAHNCNHVTARWLRELGCRVDGFVLLSNFELNP